MPDQKSLFPNSITLNGADYFLLQLDRLMWRLGRQRNICTFAVTLQNRIIYEDLTKHLASDLSYQWICRLRLHKGLPFSLAKWTHNPNTALPEIKQHQLDKLGALPESVFKMSFNMATESAFKISLVQVADAGSILVFSWHHALMDAHGGETFIRHLGKQGDFIAKNLINNQAESLLPLRERADIALAMKEFLYDISKLPIISLAKANKTKTSLRYRVLSFSKHQNKIITERAKEQGAGFLLSAFYLAVIACAIATVQKKRVPLEDVEGDMLIPIPLDCRKRGTYGSIIGNQVTFLFYRIPQAALSNVKTCVLELIEQMKLLMRSESPRHYLIMMDFLRRVPSWLYCMLLSAPTEGQMASFYYSDTGDSLDLYDKLFGNTVESAIHYPPNMYPPGMTFVLSRNQGALQLTFAYMESVISNAEVELLVERISTGLLGTNG